MMSRAHISVIVFLASIIAIGASVSTFLVMSERMERQKAELVSQAAQQKSDQAAADMAKREAQFQATKKETETRLAKVTTIQDVAKEVAALPTSNQPALGFNPFEVTLAPSGSSVVDVPDKNIIPLYKNLVECDLAKAQLGACRADVGDITTQRDAAIVQRDAWKKAATGGGKLAKLWFAVRIAGCGAVGTVPGLVSKRPDITAGGAAVASSFCVLTLHR